jgi:hypothetical protein
MPPNERVMNAAKPSFAVGIAGVMAETPCYSNGSLIGRKLSLVVNVRFLP